MATDAAAIAGAPQWLAGRANAPTCGSEDDSRS